MDRIIGHQPRSGCPLPWSAGLPTFAFMTLPRLGSPARDGQKIAPRFQRGDSSQTRNRVPSGTKETMSTPHVPSSDVVRPFTPQSPRDCDPEPNVAELARLRWETIQEPIQPQSACGHDAPPPSSQPKQNLPAHALLVRAGGEVKNLR